MSDREDIAQFVAITSTSPKTAAQYLKSTDEPPEDQAKLMGVRKPQKPAARVTPSKIKGFADLGRSDDESEEDESNEYYTGGEKSGMVVKGGDGKKGNVDSYFEQLKNAGAQMGNSEDLEGPSTGPSAFVGRSRKLGDGSGGGEAEQAQQEAANLPDKPLVHVITFWANQVFTVNDGEPRRMDDPANRAFLEAIGRGTAPPELLPSNPATGVTVNLVRNGNNYKPPARNVAFTGRGRTLAGDAPSSSRPGAAERSAPKPANPQMPWEGVDSSQPTTSIQIRLADGSRMVASFNHSHTISDIRRFIAASRPDMTADYGLMTSFPSTQLNDDSKTIEEAGLLNAVIMQKL